MAHAVRLVALQPTRRALHPPHRHSARRRRRVSRTYLAAFLGANRSRLSARCDNWIFLLGSWGERQIFVPLERYILESVPESCRAVDMPNVGGIGDAKDIQTETVRASDQKLVKNQSYSDKMHSAAARGTTFTTGSGMTTIASQLYLARGSELNGIRSVRRELARYGRRLHFCYDKGVPGIRGVLPNYNFVHMPAFLAPASGKTKFEAEEAVENRGTARALRGRGELRARD